MSYEGRYRFSFSKVPGKVMENEFTIAAVEGTAFKGFMHNGAGDHPIEGTLEGGRFAFAFAGGHKHAEQEGGPQGGPPAGHGAPGGEPLVMNFAGTIADDGSLIGTLTVMTDVVEIKGAKL